MKARASRIRLIPTWQPMIEEIFGKRESRRIMAGIKHHYQSYLQDAPPVRSRALRRFCYLIIITPPEVIDAGTGKLVNNVEVRFLNSWESVSGDITISVQ